MYAQQQPSPWFDGPTVKLEAAATARSATLSGSRTGQLQPEVGFMQSLLMQSSAAELCYEIALGLDKMTGS